MRRRRHRACPAHTAGREPVARNRCRLPAAHRRGHRPRPRRFPQSQRTRAVSTTTAAARTALRATPSSIHTSKPQHEPAALHATCRTRPAANAAPGSTAMIPRYQRILFWSLMGAILLMLAFLLRGCQQAQKRLTELNNATPIGAPSTAPVEEATLY